MIELDHLAVAGTTLNEAVTHVENALGVSMAPGGRHDVFFTHNRLLGLADGLYLEAIAVDPEAATPARPRWFDLDRFQGAARLTNWICRTGEMEAVLAGLGVDAGAPVDLRRGDLRWCMAVPETGILPFDNQFPALIQWQTPMHPADMLPDSGCVLHRLVIAHPEAKALRAALPSMTGFAVEFEVGSAGMMAEFDTPHGRRVLR